MPLPDLPDHASAPWPAQVFQAKAHLDHISSHATQALQTRSDVSRLQFHYNAVAKDAVSILHALEALAHLDSQDNLLLEWVVASTVHFGIIMCQLGDAQKTATGQ